MLKFSLCASNLFLNSVNIFITNALNSSSGKLSVLSFSFSGVFFCSFNWEQFLCLFILLNFLCLYELGETVTCCSLEGVFLCGSISIQTVCVQCLWLESWIWCGHKSHLSSGSAGSYHIGKVGAGDGGARAGAWCEADFHSAQWPAPPYWWWGVIPSCWSRSPEGWAWAGSVPFKSVFPPPHTGTFAAEQGNVEASGSPVGSQLMSACRQRLILCLDRHSQFFPLLHSDAASIARPVCPL